MAFKIDLTLDEYLARHPRAIEIHDNIVGDIDEYLARHLGHPVVTLWDTDEECLASVWHDDTLVGAIDEIDDRWVYTPVEEID